MSAKNTGVRETNGKIKFINLLAVFFLGAVLGWLWEGFFCWIRSGHWKNAGFLAGPWLPVYGLGCVLIYLLKRPLGKNVFLLFVASAISCAAVEYFTSWILEKLYRRRWWYYGKMPWNLHGRIFFGGVVFFGAAGCLIAYLVFPYYEKWLDKLPKTLVKTVMILLTAFFVADALTSLFITNVT